MKTLLTFVFATLCVYVYGQAGMATKNPQNPAIWEFDRDPWEAPIPDTIVYMSLPDAAKAEYWGQKGVASVPLIETLEKELAVSDKQYNFQHKILENCYENQEQYRKKLENVSIMYNAKITDYQELQVRSDAWEDKAKKRGRRLGIIYSGIGAALIAAAAASL